MNSETNTRWIGTAAAVAGLFVTGLASATIRSTTPSIVRIEPPPNVAADRLQSDTEILAFDERQCVLLEQDLLVNAAAPGTYRKLRFADHAIPAGTRIRCHLIHFDPIHAVERSGSVTFEEPILGVIGASRPLRASDPVCGVPGTTYGNHAASGFEANHPDSFTIEAPSTLATTLYASSPGDHVRVVTACGDPDPGGPGEDPPPTCDPPELTPPADLTAECAGPNGTVVSLGAPAARDRCCETAPRVAHDAPVLFPTGTTFVTWTATDCRGNVSEATQRVTIRDTRPPTITVRGDPTVLWPPNHRMVPVRVDVDVADACSAKPSFVLESLASSEPDDAKGGGDGHTRGDVQSVTLGQPDAAFRVRAERRGGGPGRVYTATYVGTDEAGNTAKAVLEIRVPHDRGTED